VIAADIQESKSAAAPMAGKAPPKFDAPGAAYDDIQVSQIRKVIAERLSYSKTNIPHYYVTVAVAVDNLLKVRSKLNKVSQHKISVNDMVIKAAALACMKVPQTNSSWMGDYIRQFKNVDMSVAIQTDNGLMAPTVKAANLKGLEQISKEVKDLATRAKENKLKLDELSGGTFTISNMGMFGVHNFSAIINPPQACILAVSSAEKKVVVKENDEFGVGHIMNVTLSSDHRVVDGAIAAQWGQEFKKFVEQPELMLL